MYDTDKEAHQKLANSVILYQDKPILVICGMTIGKTPALSFKYCGQESDVGVVGVNDPELDYRSIGSKIGYILFKSWLHKPYNEVSYMMRIPVRNVMGTQGLCESNVYMSGLTGGGILPATGKMSFGPQTYEVNYSNFKSMLDGKYPSIKQIAKEMADKSVVSRAFDRHWCILRDPVGPFKLMYKDTQVGYSEDLVKFVISDRYHLLCDVFDIMKEAA